MCVCVCVCHVVRQRARIVRTCEECSVVLIRAAHSGNMSEKTKRRVTSNSQTPPGRLAETMWQHIRPSTNTWPSAHGGNHLCRALLFYTRQSRLRKQFPFGKVQVCSSNNTEKEMFAVNVDQGRGGAGASGDKAASNWRPPGPLPPVHRKAGFLFFWAMSSVDKSTTRDWHIRAISTWHTSGPQGTHLHCDPSTHTHRSQSALTNISEISILFT